MRIKTFNSRMFDYSRATNMFLADISELGQGGRISFNLAGGFFIKSARTGEKRLFLFEKATETDGEIESCHFFCPGEELSAVIFND